MSQFNGAVFGVLAPAIEMMGGAGGLEILGGPVESVESCRASIEFCGQARRKTIYEPVVRGAESVTFPAGEPVRVTSHGNRYAVTWYFANTDILSSENCADSGPPSAGDYFLAVLEPPASP